MLLTPRKHSTIPMIDTTGRSSAAKTAAITSTITNTGAPGHASTTKSVVVVIRGDRMDGESVKTACLFARAKQAQILALYGIEVPRKNALEDPMPAEETCAQHALQAASALASRYEYDIETEIVKTRQFALSVVEEVNHHHCTLLVIGVPYQEQSDGASPIDEETDYIMEHATCRVLLIRGCKEQA